MTPEEISRVKRSFDAVTPHLEGLARSFYGRLFASDPAVETLFSTDPHIQRQKFVAELAELVAALDRLPEFVDHTMDLGARHAGYGVHARHYPLVREALIGALGDELGDGFDADTEAAWRLAFNLVAETMQRGADELPTVHRGGQ